MNMKKFLSLTVAAVMLISVMLTFTACSAYGGIEKNFLNAGFEVVDTTDEDGENVLDITASLKDGEVSCTVHVLKHGTLLKGNLMYAVIAEYSGDKEAMEALDDYLDGELASVLEDLDTSKIVNGNCLLIPIPLNLNIEDSVDEMIEIFNK